MPVFLTWMIYVSLAVTVCCGFYIRMFGFVLVGLIINAEKTTPYVAFILIFIGNIYTSYSTLRMRFKGMKMIIYKYYKKKIISLPNVRTIPKTLPERLFWDICKDVLPIQPEIFAMLANMLWLPSKFALVNSKEFRREVKDDRCYSQESLYSQDNNLVHLAKADDRRITRMKI